MWLWSETWCNYYLIRFTVMWEKSSGRARSDTAMAQGRAGLIQIAVNVSCRPGTCRQSAEFHRCQRFALRRRWAFYEGREVVVSRDRGHAVSGALVTAARDGRTVWVTVFVASTGRQVFVTKIANCEETSWSLWLRDDLATKLQQHDRLIPFHQQHNNLHPSPYGLSTIST